MICWRADLRGWVAALQFNCAGRSIKQGLIAVDIVSHCEPPSLQNLRKD